MESKSGTDSAGVIINNPKETPNAEQLEQALKEIDASLK